MSDPRTYTEEELQAAITAAKAPLETKVTELEGHQQSAEVEAQIAAAVAAVAEPLTTQVTDLQAQLDAKVIELQAEKDGAAAVLAFFQTAADESEAAAALAAKREARTADAKSVRVPEDHLAANLDRYAAMSDEDWAAALETWKAIAAKEGVTIDPPIPATTVLTAGQEQAGVSSGRALMREVMDLRRQGVDPRSLSLS